MLDRAKEDIAGRWLFEFEELHGELCGVQLVRASLDVIAQEKRHCRKEGTLVIKNGNLHEE